VIGVTQNAVRTLECSEHLYGTIASQMAKRTREGDVALFVALRETMKAAGPRGLGLQYRSPAPRGAPEQVEVIA